MKSISNSLLRWVMSIYLVLTLVIFGIEFTLQFSNERKSIAAELAKSQDIFHDNLSHGMWHMDTQEVDVTVAGLLKMPSVSRVMVILPNGDVFRDKSAEDKSKSQGLGQASIYSSRAPIRYSNTGSPPVDLGWLEIQSSSHVIVNRLKPWVATASLAVLLKAAILIFLVRLFFARILSKPLFNIARLAGEIDPKNVGSQPLPVKPGSPDELDVISHSINGLAAEVRSTVEALDALNKGLEGQVAERTALLQSANSSLAESLEKLHLAQQNLVESEKMAALGGLVAGVAHEINTPVGLGLTGTSHFKYMVEQIEIKFRAGELEEADFEQFLEDSKELARAIFVSLEKAAALVRSFKLVAVDQSHDEISAFNPGQYLNDVLLTHQQVLRRARVSATVACDESLQIHSYAGAWSQILSNLLTNSVVHGFAPEQGDACIQVKVLETAEELLLEYRDNGRGMSEDVMKKIYDPFFTTNRQAGGSGLGMHIVYNLVSQKLLGRIQLETAPGQGVRFLIHLPKQAEK